MSANYPHLSRLTTNSPRTTGTHRYHNHCSKTIRCRRSRHFSKIGDASWEACADDPPRAQPRYRHNSTGHGQLTPTPAGTPQLCRTQPGAPIDFRRPDHGRSMGGWARACPGGDGATSQHRAGGGRAVGADLRLSEVERDPGRASVRIAYRRWPPAQADDLGRIVALDNRHQPSGSSNRDARDPFARNESMSPGRRCPRPEDPPDTPLADEASIVHACPRRWGRWCRRSRVPGISISRFGLDDDHVPSLAAPKLGVAWSTP